MALDTEVEYDRLILKANTYHRQALWQEKLRCLQAALTICETPGFPQGDARKQVVLYEIAGIWRRLGQYDRAKRDLQASLVAFSATPLFEACVQGDLGVLARHRNQHDEARHAFRTQAYLARKAPSSIEADSEICRAVGNEGRTMYNMWQTTGSQDPALIVEATAKIRERIDRARKLQKRVIEHDPASKYLALAESWETIGLDCLALLMIADNNPVEALHIATESQQKQKREDPTVAAISRFVFGYALWHNGRKGEAVDQWNSPSGTCSSPIAFCKERSEEYNGYLQLMESAGVNFDTFDEAGYKALDYLVLGASPDAAKAVSIVEDALRNGLVRQLQESNPAISQEYLLKRVEAELNTRRRQAELRRQYRIILQEHIRPQLRAETDTLFKTLREICSTFIAKQDDSRQTLSRFHFVKYTDFKRYGELPRSTSGLTRSFDRIADSEVSEDEFMIFFSYRWIGGDKPDDGDNHQWRRVVSAAEDFLRLNPMVEATKLSLWLDYACIDQVDYEEQQRGIDALPLAVIQCNAVISLVDESYFTRAWCGVEILLIKALVQSYGLHQWWEHSNGTLRPGDIDRSIDVQKLKLTRERLDRPKVDFLMRQSKLLGKDDA